MEKSLANAVLHFQFAAENDTDKSWKLGLAPSKFAFGDCAGAQTQISAVLPGTEKSDREEMLKWLEHVVRLKPELENDAASLRNILT